MVKPLQARKIAIDQDIFQVLVEANMPAVLLELAFISNPTEYKYLASQSGQEEIADRLFQAFKSYKTKYDMSLNLETSTVVVADTPQIQEPVEKDAEELTSFYAVQIMSVAKLLKSDDPQLKGLKAEPYRPEGATTYKYIIGRFNTREQANAELKKIKAKFPQAFIIYVDKK
jgi:N-acetylmuramoyl-L-alanine amidase